MINVLNEPLKPLVWVASSLKDLKAFPRPVQSEVGFALDQAQRGLHGRNVKVMKCFGGATVLEVVEDFQTDTYRAVYTVRFSDIVYVLHCFQKKSKRGSETPKADRKLILQRLRDAEEIDRRRKAE